MEKNLLLYIIYEALLLIRSRSSSNSDDISFELANLLHNVPLQLMAGESNEDVYKKFLHHAKGEFMERWIKMVQDKFANMHPEYKI